MARRYPPRRVYVCTSGLSLVKHPCRFACWCVDVWKVWMRPAAEPSPPSTSLLFGSPLVTTSALGYIPYAGRFKEPKPMCQIGPLKIMASDARLNHSPGDLHRWPSGLRHPRRWPSRKAGWYGCTNIQTTEHRTLGEDFLSRHHKRPRLYCSYGLRHASSHCGAVFSRIDKLRP
jgi:hypothetical protein